MIEPVVMAPGPASSHIGRCPCGDSWIHLYVAPLGLGLLGICGDARLVLTDAFHGSRILRLASDRSTVAVLAYRLDCFSAFRHSQGSGSGKSFVTVSGFRCLFRLLEALPSSMVMWLIGLQ